MKKYESALTAFRFSRTRLIYVSLKREPKIKAVAVKVRLTNCMGVRIGREIVSLALKLRELHIKPALSV